MAVFLWTIDSPSGMSKPSTPHIPGIGHGRRGGTRMVAVHASGPSIKDAKYNPCVKIGKNLKSIRPFSKWEPLKLCKVPNEEIHIVFG